MGVPAFYRWLSEKYPKAVLDLLEVRPEYIENIPIPVNTSEPSPNLQLNIPEFDNLYIDMNGIIHPCSHPESGPQPTTEVEMFTNVVEYVDRIFCAVRPRKLLFLAIDGVAPRAKMNQQRSRRFRSAQEARESMMVKRKVIDDLKASGRPAPDLKKPWDSNVITPGTKFMRRLSDYVKFYIQYKVSTNSHWGSIKVLFSDASIPGEGEHKIMSLIRRERTVDGYDPNTRHILHGLDADLIMLALATHEAHFFILREEVQFGRRSAEANQRRRVESGVDSLQKQLDSKTGVEGIEKWNTAWKPFQCVSIATIREYLYAEFAACQSVPFGFNFEQIVDDIVFMCFFVGNDFLPHLPSLDIRDGGLDYLFNTYRRILPSMGGYITSDGGKVDLGRVDMMLAEVAAIEDKVFKERHHAEMQDKQRRMRQKASRRGDQHQAGQSEDKTKAQVLGRAARAMQEEKSDDATKSSKGEAENRSAAEKLKMELMGNKKREKKEEKKGSEDVKTDDAGDNAFFDDDDSSSSDGEEDELNRIDCVLEQNLDTDITPEEAEKAKRDMKDIIAKIEREKLDKFSESVVDNVRLHEDGWKDRYYSDKCKLEDIEHKGGGREELFKEYIVGLTWVMRYYYDGVCSWKWFYPFHYAPFSSDLRNIERFQADCDALYLAKPFTPVEQLMGVLPPDSAHAVPKKSRKLMTDLNSPIHEFYPPGDVPVDPNGKAMPWLFVVLLPFIDEKKLLDAFAPTRKKWVKEELACDELGVNDALLICCRDSSLGSDICERENNSADEVFIQPEIHDGFSGFVPKILEGGEGGNLTPPKFASASSRDNNKNGIFLTGLEDKSCVFAFNFPEKKKHQSRMLPGVIPQESVLTESDLRIRRPKLNRGPMSIAELGGAPVGGLGMGIGEEQRMAMMQAGSGGMTGQRSWGTMEPSSKRQRTGGQMQQIQQQFFGQPPPQMPPMHNFVSNFPPPAYGVPPPGYGGPPPQMNYGRPPQGGPPPTRQNGMQNGQNIQAQIEALQAMQRQQQRQQQQHGRGGYQQPPPNFSQPPPNFSQPPPNFSQPPPTLSQHPPNFQQPPGMPPLQQQQQRRQQQQHKLHPETIFWCRQQQTGHRQLFLRNKLPVQLDCVQAAACDERFHPQALRTRCVHNRQQCRHSVGPT